MSLLALPDELLLIITSNLSANDIFSLTLMNRRLAHSLSPILTKLMLESTESPSALFHAAARRDRKFIKHLLENAEGIDVVVSKQYWTSAQRTNNPEDTTEREYPTECRGADPALLEFVMERGPNLVLNVAEESFSKDPQPVLAIEWAARYGSASLLDLILERGEELERRALGKGLRAACAVGNLRAAKVLIEAGADVNEEERDIYPRDGRDSLRLATLGEHVPVMRFLIKAGMDGESLRLWFRPNKQHFCVFCNPPSGVEDDSNGSVEVWD